jgi:hypothetical protein
MGILDIFRPKRKPSNDDLPTAVVESLADGSAVPDIADGEVKKDTSGANIEKPTERVVLVEFAKSPHNGGGQFERRKAV